MSNLKEEPTTPLWKVDVFLMIALVALIFSPIVLIVLFGFIAEIFQNNELLVSILGLFLLGVFFFVITSFALIILYRRKLYGETGINWYNDDFYKPRTRCVICKRHPVSKGYHLKHIHKLSKDKKEDYFENCRCEICVPPPYLGSISFAKILNYLK